MKRLLFAGLACIVVCAMVVSLTMIAGNAVHAMTLRPNASCQSRHFSPGGLVMQPGDEVHATSCKGTDIKLRFQLDGNLVLSIGGVAKWGTGTDHAFPQPDAPFEVNFQSDGNLVLYYIDPTHNPAVTVPAWGSGTDKRGSELDLQADGNLVIYHDNSNGTRTPILASNTCCVP